MTTTDCGTSSREPDDPVAVADRPERSRLTVLTGGALLSVAVVLVALNLRPAITSVGPLLDEVRAGLGASTIWAGALTTIPGLCFAIAGLAAPVLARRLGMGPAIGMALTVLAAGLVLRVLDGPLVVLGGTLVATAGIAFANVLIPVVVKDSFPLRVGLMTGVYTAALQAGGAFGSALTPPLDSALGGWRPALGVWSLLAVTALIVWLFAARGARRPETGGTEQAESGKSMARNGLAWMVMVFFGLQAFLAYVVMGWLPQVVMDAGMSRGATGVLLGVVFVLPVPISLLLPPLAARQRGQSWWVVVLTSFSIAGLLGLMLAPSAAPVLWCLLLGVGMSVFSLVLVIIALRARTGPDTARLSGMAQGGGYLLAAAGPFLFGLLHDVTDGWTVPIGMLLVVLLLQLVFGWQAGRDRYV